MIRLKVGKEIQVSGLDCFPESRWREAILSYLFGVWSGRQGVMYRPKLYFSGITLRLGNGEYYAYGQSTDQDQIPSCNIDQSVVERSEEKEKIEVALMRFVKNDRIKQLHLLFPSMSDTSSFVLWKKKGRGEYGCAGLNLPYTWGEKGPVWTEEDSGKQFGL